MKNRLTFANVINILIENKKKTYPQHKLICDLFSVYLGSRNADDTIYSEDNTMFSRWCTGARPIPMEILRTYEDDENFDVMEDDFRDEIIPNLINESLARTQMEELVCDSTPVIGSNKACELNDIKDNAAFFTQIIRYAILSDHEHNGQFSPDLSDDLLNCMIPSVNMEFTGRKEEVKECAKLLQDNNVVFINGVAGIGKSEFAKCYARKNHKKYTNIIYMYYSGSLRQNIIQMDFADDTDDFSEDVLYEKHYAILKKLRGDSLIILDNFNVLPKDEPLFKEFAQNRFKLLITTRCHLKNYPVLTLTELDKDTELTQLFFKHCPSAKGDADTVSKIIDTLHCHTLTVILAALSLSASGMEADEMLYELQTCGLNLSSGEDVELYKDGDYTDGLMTEHLRKLLQLGKLSNSRLDILRNLSLLPLSGVLKASFKSWLKLTDLNDVNYLAKYGFINDDSENRSISLHPLIQEVVFLEMAPAVSTCRTLIDSLHIICLVHGLEVRKPRNVIDSLISVTEHIIMDEPAVFLLFLQDMFPYLEKYLVTEYLPKVVARIEYVMGEIKYSDENTTLCDRALLLDYKAELFYVKKDYANTLKKRQKAISILESLPTEKADLRTASLLSNLYNNLSNVYLMMKKSKETAEALMTAINIRREYAHLGLIESHDMLQQMLNLSNMLLLSKENDMALQVLSTYEALVLEYEGSHSFDYGVCELMHGVIALSAENATEAENRLLSAESIIGDVMGCDNDYMKSVYQYLYYLYTRWNKSELAFKYEKKYSDSHTLLR